MTMNRLSAPTERLTNASLFSLVRSWLTGSRLLPHLSLIIVSCRILTSSRQRLQPRADLSTHRLDLRPNLDALYEFPRIASVKDQQAERGNSPTKARSTALLSHCMDYSATRCGTTFHRRRSNGFKSRDLHRRMSIFESSLRPASPLRGILTLDRRKDWFTKYTDLIVDLTISVRPPLLFAGDQ
jgi:hypothetical protein